MPNFYKQLDFGAILDFHGFQKGTLRTIFSHKVSSFAVTCSWFGRPCRDPAFHETIVTAVPFGPSIFETNICSIKIDSTSVFAVFLCGMFYIQCLSKLLIIPQ